MAAGSRGSCKVCSTQYVEQINRMIEQGKNEAQIRRAIQAVDPEIYWSRPTFRAHKEHITHPLVTQAEAARRNPVIVPKTNRGALEMIRDVGLQNIRSGSIVVTPDHTLKALQIMEQSKRPVENIFVVLAKLMNQTTPEETGEVIVGQWTESTEEENLGSA